MHRSIFPSPHFDNMHLISVSPLLLLLLHLPQCLAGYTIVDDYSGVNFFDNFEAFSDADPTHGFVLYGDYQQALAKNLIGSASNYNDASYMAADSHSQISTGRSSVRISSKKSYNHGIFIADIAHMPGGICGVWPAFWLVGPNWPNDGEIDIIEGVNDQNLNQMTLHVNGTCQIDRGGFSGSAITTDCNNYAPTQSQNAGCGIQSPENDSYGASFNAVGGGVFATLWNSTVISIWFWPRNSIPPDIQSRNPQPQGWTTPMARFGGACDIDQHFRDMQIVFDTTFCGDWAGQVWNQSECRSKAATCEEFVGQNPEAFAEAYWLVNSVEVYEET